MNPTVFRTKLSLSISSALTFPSLPSINLLFKVLNIKGINRVGQRESNPEYHPSGLKQIDIKAITNSDPLKNDQNFRLKPMS